MKQLKTITYGKKEEQLNVLTHGIGFLFSVFALVAMVLKIEDFTQTKPLIGVVVFGVSMMVLYGASTLYHASKNEKTRNKLRVFDHASIYILIAGTYTPFALISLPQNTGWVLFSVTWTMAIAGIILKLFFTGRFDIWSTVMYVLMGWAIVFAFQPLIEEITFTGFLWLLIGGVTYTIGAVIYQIKAIPYNHAIFHTFVLAGSVMHFVAVYHFVLHS